MFRTKSDISIFQAELEVHQRHEVFTKYHPHHFSRNPITRPDSSYERCRIEHNSHQVTASPVMPSKARFCRKEVPPCSSRRSSCRLPTYPPLWVFTPFYSPTLQMRGAICIADLFRTECLFCADCCIGVERLNENTRHTR